MPGLFLLQQHMKHNTCSPCEVYLQNSQINFQKVTFQHNFTTKDDISSQRR